MSAPFVSVNRSATPRSGDLYSLLDQAKNNIGFLQKHWAAMRQMVDNPTTPTDFTVLESQYGIPTGKGAVVYAAIGQVMTDFAASQGLVALTQIG